MPTIEVIRTVKEMQSWSERQRLGGKRIACVPTMGYLHEGHLSLIREGRKRADLVVMTLFVNPTQFAPHEDFNRYPRDEAGDLKKAEAAGAVAVYMPNAAEMYPADYQTYVTVEEATKAMEGAIRPGHFRGVATVVLKLFNAVLPQVAVFGEKDYQQLTVIKRMVKDLDLGVEIVGHPTVREPDGLAMSSRNVYLSADERARALAISRSLFAAQQAVAEGERDSSTLINAARRTLDEAGLQPDYVEVLDAETLAPLTRIAGPARMLIAARAGKTRLLDNLGLDPGSESGAGRG